MPPVRSVLRWLTALLCIPQNATGLNRPSFHNTPEANWMNDPQRPFYASGEWHLYYLYNANFDFDAGTGSGGTEWYHVTSIDMVTWVQRGVVIEKYKPAADGSILGDVETGSAVIDTQNTAGFGNGAIVAILTQMQDGIQQQSLFRSNNSGYTFTDYTGNPIMPNPDPATKPAFRDPKVIWDQERSRWVALMAEGNKIGFYSSVDLRSWSYINGFYPKVDLGLLECPDMFQLDLDGDSTKRTWILALSANGYLYGQTTGTAYWTGTWDGTTFTTDAEFPQWMDDGPDFYAAVSWADSRVDEVQQHASRFAIAWLSNWDYAKDLPYYGGWAGQNSLVRNLQLKTSAGIPTIVGVPLSQYDDAFGSEKTAVDKVVSTDPGSVSLPSMAGGAYKIKLTVQKNSADTANEVRIRIKGGGVYGTSVGYDFTRAQAFIVRGTDGTRAHGMPEDAQQAYDASRPASVPDKPISVTLTIYVDWNSVEMFVNEGVKSMSALIYPDDGAETIQVTTDSGQLALSSFVYAELRT